jgi:putative ABC transport system permease protein
VLRSANFKGVPPNWAAVTSARLADGRFFSEFENTHRMKVVVLGADPAEAMFPQADAVGKAILINGAAFTVVGVLAHSRGSFLGQSETDNQVIVPYESWHKMMPAEQTHFLLIQAKPGKLAQALDETESLLRRRRGVKPGEARNFDLSTSERVIQQFDAITATIGLIAIAISGIGLLVGGIGVMNIMLVSVTERTREIGIRMATGARQRDILAQFLSEAIVVSCVGGMIGILFGIGIGLLVQRFGVPIQFSASVMLLAFTCSASIGLVFGFAPARKAARLDPVVALANE